MHQLNYDWVVPLLGLPWEAYATGPEAYDCHGILCYGKYQHQCVEIDRHLEVITDDIAGIHAAIKSEQETGAWVQLDKPSDGCVVLMAQGTRWRHVGMWLDVNGGRVLNSRHGRGVCLDGFKELEALGFRKFEFWELAECIT